MASGAESAFKTGCKVSFCLRGGRRQTYVSFQGASLKSDLFLFTYFSFLRWKDTNCKFRKDHQTKLMVLPTLARWKQPQKLEGEQCENPDLVDMLFTDE